MLCASERDGLQMWGGVECTVNRVGDEYGDQLRLSGHHERIGDLDLFASLGIKTLRYPVLWQRTAPDGLATADWSWSDERLARLRKLEMCPVVGLTHHGSGPRHTSLLDPNFAAGLAEFAGAVAERYPWVECYTPVNEPLTTARFSALYGHWYPHARDPHSFGIAMLNECRGVVLSMRAIRAVNPRAQLIQTEDLGKAYATPTMQYQADFENERRWLTFDLLCGRVDRHHAMFHFLRWAGIAEEEILWFQDNSCAPDIIGINHYVTSERYLDDRIDMFPPCSHGSNGRHTYADVEAVRAWPDGLTGPRGLLAEAWERYELPIVVTECHLGCDVTEQARWMWEVWRAARDLRARGMDVRAVTAWALLGSFDWDSLLTRFEGNYEPGVFDLRAGQPEPTRLAHLVRQLARGEEPDDPRLHQTGWWHRPERLLYFVDEDLATAAA